MEGVNAGFMYDFFNILCSICFKNRRVVFSITMEDLKGDNKRVSSMCLWNRIDFKYLYLFYELNKLFFLFLINFLSFSS